MITRPPCTLSMRSTRTCSFSSPTGAGSFIRGGNDSDVAPSTPAGGGTSTGPGGGGLSGDCSINNLTFPGSVTGSPGSGSAGGSGGDAPRQAGGGGGGGGGYFGGGGGGSGQLCSSTPPGCVLDGDGSAGGGGSSYITPSAGINSGITGGSLAAPSVTYTPEVEIDSPVNGATYGQRESVDASFACAPNVTIGCTGTVASGRPFDTSTVGLHTFVVRGQIPGGGPAFAGTVTYTVFGVTTTSLPSGSVYSSSNKIHYSATLAAIGGNLPYKWSLAAGSGPLPPGLRLSSKGVISGKATTAGTYPFVVQVKDKKTTTKPHTQNTATMELSITIS